MNAANDRLLLADQRPSSVNASLLDPRRSQFDPEPSQPAPI